jgi:hypothetical protein
MDLTGNGKSKRKGGFGDHPEIGVSVQRVRIPPGQSEDPQAGSEPCNVAGNRGGET